MSMGTRIKEARQAANLNQEQLAKILGISKGAIGNYEADISHPKEEILIALMTTLNVDANYMYQDYIEIKKAPADCESDPQMQELIENYKSLNPLGRSRLVEQSEDMTTNIKYTEVSTETASKNEA